MSDLSLKVGMIILMEAEPHFEECVEFYKKIGFQLKFHLKEKWAEFNLDNIRIGLCPTGHPAFDRHTGVVLEVNDINLFEDKIKEQGITFLKEPVVALHGIMANIKDPSGNVMDVYQPTHENVEQMAKKMQENN